MGVLVCRRKGVIGPLKPPSANDGVASSAVLTAASPRLAALLFDDKEEQGTASMSIGSSASSEGNQATLPVFRLDPTRQTVVPLPRAGGAAIATTVASHSRSNSESSNVSLSAAGPRSSLNGQLDYSEAATSKLKRPGWRRSSVGAGDRTAIVNLRAGDRTAIVHPGGEGDGYSNAQTNLHSPVPFPSLVAPSPSSPSSMPHAPGGAAGEMVWRRTRVYGTDMRTHVPPPGVLREAGLLKESLSVCRQEDALRRRCASDSSEEDDSYRSSSTAKTVVSSRPTRREESTADWSGQCASRTRMVPPTAEQSMHPTSAAARQPWAHHTSVSRLNRLRTSLGEPTKPAARQTPDPASLEEVRGHALPGLIPNRRSRTSDWAPPETMPTAPSPLPTPTAFSAGGARSSCQPRRKGSNGRG
ncbi:hypothetical protein T492DRAFT_1008368 [Pavlovales sp. CCMP2436]|nr:hypothetical protein T492DRAFT_1008368 [Pavlovales sp. CCMP2436]